VKRLKEKALLHRPLEGLSANRWGEGGNRTEEGLHHSDAQIQKPRRKSLDCGLPNKGEKKVRRRARELEIKSISLARRCQEANGRNAEC